MPNEVKPDRNVESPDRALIITRLFDAPRELVFEAFTEPKHLMKWWGPHGCTVTSCETDPKNRGTWRITMRSPKLLPQFSNRYPAKVYSGPSQPSPDDVAATARGIPWIIERQRGVYQEVMKPERLIFTYAFENEAGQPLHQSVVTLTFAEEAGKTRLTLHQASFESVSARDDHVRGWTQALQQLAEHLTHDG